LLTELALSIKEVGLLQPPVVRSIGNGKYQLIMGERRFRAAKLAGLKSIPVIIRQTSDDQLLREALIENIHRSQLNPLEEGAAYQQLLNDFSYTHDELATKLSKSRPAITNTMRLLNLPPAVQRKVGGDCCNRWGKGKKWWNKKWKNCCTKIKANFRGALRSLGYQS